MNKFFLLVINRHQDIIRYTIILSSIVVISFFFPNSGIFKYEFSRDKPWKYDNLYAPFDIVIEKSQEQVDEEKEYKQEEFPPYYRFNPEVAIEEKERFVDSFNVKLKETPNAKIDSQACVELGLDLLDTIYARGIIDLDSSHQSHAPGKPMWIFTQKSVAKKGFGGELK